jgi:hypothetical protein
MVKNVNDFVAFGIFFILKLHTGYLVSIGLKVVSSFFNSSLKAKISFIGAFLIENNVIIVKVFVLFLDDF